MELDPDMLVGPKKLCIKSLVRKTFTLVLLVDVLYL